MLDYFALGLLCFVGVILFYGVIVIHDIPYDIAKHRNHPHQDAIHVAGWISLLTLHVIWPFLWIWATLYREDRGWGFSRPEGPGGSVQGGQQASAPGGAEVAASGAGGVAGAVQASSDAVAGLRDELVALQARLARLEERLASRPVDDGEVL